MTAAYSAANAGHSFSRRWKSRPSAPAPQFCQSAALHVTPFENVASSQPTSLARYLAKIGGSSALAVCESQLVCHAPASALSDDTFVAAVEVVALDRTRLLRDVANALSDQRVNIVSCTTQTGNDRVARMRFEFEFSDPSHLQAMLRLIKNIDGVYDAFRLLPGADESRTTGDAHPSNIEAN
ncbi:MAG: ACT domain-containing protein [Acidimicrobiia bacterium]|nr:ACT domain-containing protein [Acidimicrobiia bacterium]